MERVFSDVDWQAIKTEYITTDTSLSKLAEKYGCSKAQIGKVCAKDGWVEARKQFVADVLSETVAHEVEAQSQRLIKLMEATTRAIDVAMEALDVDRQFYRYIVNEGVGEGMSRTHEKQFEKLDTKALKEFVGILKDLTALARDFDNAPTPGEAEARRINRRRLELEEKKIAALSGDEEDAGTGIALIPPVIEVQDDE